MDADPLSIFLVKSDSKGDRLLFKYPYKKSGPGTSKDGVGGDGQSSWRRKTNPYSLILPDDSHSKDFRGGFPDEVLSNLFAVKQELCDAKFELKVNNVRFVGHPTLGQNCSRKVPKSPSKPIMLVNVVFALQAPASHSIVKCYYELSKQLGVALRHEERRSGYLTQQIKLMIAAQDDRAEDSNPDNYKTFEVIVDQCSLAKDLKKVYDDLCNHGLVQLRVNGWVYVGFCLPHKVHYLHNRTVKVSPEAITKYMENVKPYHGMLLLVDAATLMDSLVPDCSPTLTRLIKIYTPLKSLQTLAADADLTLRMVCNLASHLVYWGKAIIIYPLCESNVYMAAPNNVIHTSSPLVEKFGETFPGQNLIQTIAEFSFPTSIRQMMSPINGNDHCNAQVIIWLLQHRLLLQLHTYIYYMPTNRGLPQQEQASGGGGKSEGSICELSTPSETMSLSGLESDGESAGEDNGNWETEDFLARLSPEERTTLINIPASPHQLKLLIRLIQLNYLLGDHHLEDIMYLENLRRSQLLQLLDKFREVLITCEAEDPTLDMFYPQR
uniref:GATOR complex protein NPRL3 n=2 Tax=Lygus hesperus TaxID=30085 RepID=A0A0K8TF05_LYGHE